MDYRIINMFFLIFILNSCIFNNKCDKDINNVVIEHFNNDSLALVFKQRFLRFDARWEQYLRSNVVKVDINNHDITIYLYSLPQYCADCIQSYKLLLIDTYCDYHLFPIIDTYYCLYDSFNSNALQESFNKFRLERPELFNNYDNRKFFLDQVYKKILGYTSLTSKSDLSDIFIKSDECSGGYIDIVNKFDNNSIFIYYNNRIVNEILFDKDNKINLNCYFISCDELLLNNY